jgi:hypothetical protein|tara:strand:- start:277 stop:435 length:159 start_codon:yes stop_codon:yes gene_type:complete
MSISYFGFKAYTVGGELYDAFFLHKYKSDSSKLIIRIPNSPEYGEKRPMLFE